MKTLAQIQRTLQTSRDTQSRMQGQLDAAMETMQREFGVKTKAAATKLQSELDAAATDARAAADDALEAFAAEFPEIAT